MNIILIEDDNFKENMIKKSIFDLSNENVVSVARSVAGAVKLLTDQSFDLVILDVSLPSHDKSKSAPSLQMPSGGLEVLYELAFEDRKEPVIIVTQYPEIELEDKKSVPIHKARDLLVEATGVDIRRVIYFDRSDDAWRRELLEAING
jgi:DNA-binding response OmpR family regulator